MPLIKSMVIFFEGPGLFWTNVSILATCYLFQDRYNPSNGRSGVLFLNTFASFFEATIESTRCQPSKKWQPSFPRISRIGGRPWIRNRQCRPERFLKNNQFFATTTTTTATTTATATATATTNNKQQPTTTATTTTTTTTNNNNNNQQQQTTNNNNQQQQQQQQQQPTTTNNNQQQPTTNNKGNNNGNNNNNNNCHIMAQWIPWTKSLRLWDWIWWSFSWTKSEKCCRPNYPKIRNMKLKTTIYIYKQDEKQQSVCKKNFLDYCIGCLFFSSQMRLLMRLMAFYRIFMMPLNITCWSTATS